MIGFAKEKGYVELLDGREANARYLTFQLGRFVLMLVVGRES